MASLALNLPGLSPAKPGEEDITLFTQELSWMIGAGVPLGRAIDLLLADHASPRMEPVLRSLRADLRAGTALSQALQRQDGVFPESYVRLIALAEQAGTLPLVLSRLYEGRAQARALRRKIGSAMVYPAFLLVVAISAILMIALTVVPQLRSVLPPQPLASGADASIRRLIAASDFLLANGLPLGLGAAVLLAILAWASLQPAVRLAVAEAAAPLPAIGPLVQASRLAGLTRNLAMLTEAGLPFAEALKLSRRSTASPTLSRTLEAMEQALRAGGDVTAPLAGNRAFPPFLSSLIRVGQETGDLGRSLGQAASVFEEKTRIALDRALVLMEPLIILLISGAVGSLIYVVISALMSVNDLIL